MADFDKSLDKIRFIFNISGITFEILKLNRKELMRKRLIYFFNFVSLNIDTVGAICYFIDGIRTGKSFVEITYVAPCITFAVLSNWKPLYFIRYETLVCELLDDLRKLENKNSRPSDEKAAIRREETRLLHAVLKSSNIINLFVVLTFTFSPIILTAIKYIFAKEVELILPLLIKYPFDPQELKYWPYVYVHQFWSVVLVFINISGTDFVLFICCIYLRIQFRLLQCDIRNIIASNTTLTGRELILFQHDIVELVKWHQELIRLTNLLEFTYSKSTLFNFLSSSLLICLTGFNVVAMQNLAFAVTFLVFLLASLLQIYSLCYFGDLLMHSSMEIGNAVYSSKWYNINAKAGKTLLIMQTRSQKPCKLTAFGFSDVNLSSFMSILSSAWSYFALLKTLYSPTEN